MGNARIIFHVDMNSFYASVEQAHHPELRGQPLAIAGRVEERRGIIVTSSYEARARGVKTTMRVREARRLCPDLIVQTPNFPLYRETSAQLFQLLKTYTPLVEKVSIDEGYLDVTEIQRGQHPVTLAQEIQQKILDDLKLPSSIGIAPNKFLAKMASNMKKPMGLTILRKRDIPQLLWPMAIGEMHGVGPKTAEKLNRMGVLTIGDLASHDRTHLKQRLGQHGEKLYDRANGIDAREVDPTAESIHKSMSQSSTFPTDLTQLMEARPSFHRFSETLAKKLQQSNNVAYQVQIQIRYSNWEQVTRMKTVDTPLYSTESLYELAMELFEEHWTGRPIRLLGLSVGRLAAKRERSKQLDLFTYEEEAKKEPLYQVLDLLKERFGDGKINLGPDQASR
ncbi:DNA polymerase IV [Pullulanibacillus sp. KACC 23026]|uniref:DNA polymerase IV n=1 Tax=Pullulanibacillus sp. KACC 23026 TaxID=3028315 RepID=UPI0023AFCF7E|nr:DNA polymerase IV [Pullulanibacillus sp. KACC 23026]WEG14347.1 DNA polymerase IV [Pullulanibacillus sp. KACC 23026]